MVRISTQFTVAFYRWAGRITTLLIPAPPRWTHVCIKTGKSYLLSKPLSFMTSPPADAAHSRTAPHTLRRPPTPRSTLSHTHPFHTPTLSVAPPHLHLHAPKTLFTPCSVLRHRTRLAQRTRPPDHHRHHDQRAPDWSRQLLHNATCKPGPKHGL